MDSRRIINGPIYTVPSEFARRFLHEFPEYRIRWSFKRQQWHIEQKCGRGALPPIHIDEANDGLIRARDGYWLVMALQPGDRMACPELVTKYPERQICGLTLKVPHRMHAEVVCPQCKSKRRDGRTMAGYWPLDECLIEHMKMTDPLRDGTRRMREEADRLNQYMIDSAERDQSTYNQAVGADYFNRLYGIPTFGYTGSSNIIHRDKGLK